MHDHAGEEGASPGGRQCDLVVRSRRVVTPDGERALAVAVRGGLIEALCPYDDPPGAPELVDLGDLPLLPGLV
ncbi:hypothetical protein GSF24_36190, partial [Microbispora triticiradicis]|nr:hypothetical protein [Microbispora triticiradicis]